MCRERDAVAGFAQEYSPGAIGKARNYRVAVNPDSYLASDPGVNEELERMADELLGASEEKTIISEEVCRDPARSR